MTFVTIEVVSSGGFAASVCITSSGWDVAGVNCVVALASFDNIYFITCICSSSEDVVTFATPDFIVACLTVNVVISVFSVKVIISCTTSDEIIASSTEHIVVGFKRTGVLLSKNVIACTSEKFILISVCTGYNNENVVTILTVQLITSLETKQNIVASSTKENFVHISTIQNVVTATA